MSEVWKLTSNHTACLSLQDFKMPLTITITTTTISGSDQAIEYKPWRWIRTEGKKPFGEIQLEPKSEWEKWLLSSWEILIPNNWHFLIFFWFKLYTFNRTNCYTGSGYTLINDPVVLWREEVRMISYYDTSNWPKKCH